MYKIKSYCLDTLVVVEGNSIARFYGADGVENAKLFISAKEKANEVFVKDGKTVPQEY